MLVHALRVLPTSFSMSSLVFSFFFFNDTATTEIYTLSLHDALPITSATQAPATMTAGTHHRNRRCRSTIQGAIDRKSTRLNSSHITISYAVFCLKKKKKIKNTRTNKYSKNKTQNDS